MSERVAAAADLGLLDAAGEAEILALAAAGAVVDSEQDALVLLDQRRLDLKTLITHRVRLDDLQSGFEILLDPAGQAGKVVVVMEKPAV